jgi:hypothetical protein
MNVLNYYMEKGNKKMFNYLSFGGGVNSTAMYLVLLGEGVIPGDPQDGFEAIYVDHGCDWPETREYVKRFAENFPLTILTPQVEGFSNLYEYSSKYNMFPSRIKRWCTDKFKVRVILKYTSKPCFQMIGFSSDEAHRAKLSVVKGVENRFPLLEREIDRDGCIKIIKDHGLDVPIKSGCYFCPFQRVGQWRQLRKVHPELFCKAKKLEDNCAKSREKRGKKPIYLVRDKPLETVLDRNLSLFDEQDPPCNCGL